MKPVAQLEVVLKLQRTAGSSVTHRRPNLFNWLKILGLSPYKIMSWRARPAHLSGGVPQLPNPCEYGDHHRKLGTFCR
jgi:hypothetical protein